VNYNLTKPCDNCPFRSDKLFPLNTDRAEEIIYGNAEFACHKTVDYSEEDAKVKAKSEHCAGLLIMLEHMNQPHQMMRISERVGVYDRSKLEMDSPVYNHADDYLDNLSCNTINLRI